MQFNLPFQIGRYEILREVGRSNAVVFEGYDPLFGRRVAVKLLNAARGASGGQSQDEQARFIRELQANAAVSHPNVMQVFDVGVWQSFPFLVAEFMEGEPLSTVLARRGRFDVAQTAAVLAPVLSALDVVHRQGVVHRDLKPENVMILADGTPKLIDFGIARIDRAPTMTVAGAIFGTPHYMSPEQALGQRADARSDLYSIGVIAHVLLSGSNPFQRPSIGEMLAAVANYVPPPVPNLAPDVNAFLSKAIAKDPSSRFQTAAEMSAAILSLGAKGASPVARGQIQARQNPNQIILNPAPQPATAAPAPHQAAAKAAPARQGAPQLSVPLPSYAKYWKEALIVLLLAALIPVVKYALMLVAAIGSVALWHFKGRKVEPVALGLLVIAGFAWNPYAWFAPPARVSASPAPPVSSPSPTKPTTATPVAKSMPREPIARPAAKRADKARYPSASDLLGEPRQPVRTIVKVEKVYVPSTPEASVPIPVKVAEQQPNAKPPKTTATEPQPPAKPAAADLPQDESAPPTLRRGSRIGD